MRPTEAFRRQDPLEQNMDQAFLPAHVTPTPSRAHVVDSSRLGSSAIIRVAPSRLETRNGAYELKFVLPDVQVDAVLDWAREHLPADPHASWSADETYRICSVYLDTDDLAVYRRQPGFTGSKYRLRRYGGEETIYLEEKRKCRGWVSKVRTGISEAELALLQTPDLPAEWAGVWFRQALTEQQLRPRCQVAYCRLAREGETEGEPVRLTIDRHIECSRVAGLLPDRQFEPQARISLTLLELKFRNGLPRLFKGLVRTFGLSPVATSKYRHAAQACGLHLSE